MNPQTTSLLSNLEALFTSQVKMAEAHGLDTLPHISTARGRTILQEIKIARAAIKPKKDPAFFEKLDAMHS